MNGSQKAIGFDRKIRLGWLDAAAEWTAQGMSAAEIRAKLDLLLEGEVTGEAARKKTKGVLLRTWLLVVEDLRPLRDEALTLLAERPGPDRLLLHWGMVCANYPVVWEVASVVGRLLSLQENVSLAQLRRRIVETYGERSTLIRASQRIVRSFVDWGVLVETQEKGVYLPAAALPVSDERLSAWLVEAALRTTGREIGVLTSVLGSPALFPFNIERFSAQLLEQSPRLELYRQNRDEDLVRLHVGKKREQKLHFDTVL